MENVEKRQSSVIIKIFLVQLFYIMEQKSRTHIVFWALAITYIPILPKTF